MVLRIGIIGAGSNTKLRHIPGFQAIEEVQIVAVCNRSLKSAKKVADTFNIPRITECPNDIINANDIDAICIGTWPYMHKQFTIASLEAGKHVLTEARMAMNLAEAREMLVASEASDKVSICLLYTSPSPRDKRQSRMPSSA